jgi:hypothetical protein
MKKEDTPSLRGLTENMSKLSTSDEVHKAYIETTRKLKEEMEEKNRRMEEMERRMEEKETRMKERLRDVEQEGERKVWEKEQLAEYAKRLDGRSNRDEQSERSMNSAQRSFWGRKDDNINLWIVSIELNLETARIKEVNKVNVVAGYLQDGKLEVYQRYKSQVNGQMTWKGLKQALRTRYRPENFQDIVFERLSTMKQVGRVVEYADEFARIVNQFDENFPEEVKRIATGESKKDKSGEAGIIGESDGNVEK